MESRYYICDSDLWSLYIKGQKKFTKDGIYECIGKDVYINDQGNRDDISVEKWQKHFTPINLEDVNIDEITEILKEELTVCQD